MIANNKTLLVGALSLLALAFGAMAKAETPKGVLPLIKLDQQKNRNLISHCRIEAATDMSFRSTETLPGRYITVFTHGEDKRVVFSVANAQNTLLTPTHFYQHQGDNGAVRIWDHSFAGTVTELSWFSNGYYLRSFMINDYQDEDREAGKSTSELFSVSSTGGPRNGPRVSVIRKLRCQILDQDLAHSNIIRNKRRAR